MSLERWLSTAAGVGWLLVVLQARVVYLQRRAMRKVWERATALHEQLKQADALMSAITRDKLAEKGTAR